METTATWEGILKNYFTDIMTTLKGAGTAVAEQVPLYVKELLTYNFYENCLKAGICIFIMFLLTLALRYIWKEGGEADKKGESTDIHWVTIVVLVAFMVVTFFKGIGYTNQAVKIKIAPRVVVVEKIQEMIEDTKTKK
jgi:preprotein translocase subunit SecG